MSERNGFGPGVPCWVDTWQPDAAKAAAFYAALFGWETEGTAAPAGATEHVMCRLRGRDVAAIGGREPGVGSDLPTAWSTYVQVANVDDAVAAVISAGGGVVMEPFDSLDRGRMAVIVDPVGAALGIWQVGSHRGAQVVNEPSAWAMSVLLCDEPEKAHAFYPSVFGWEAEPFALGDAEGTLWRLPGYVGGEPQQPVPRDVVAAMAPAFGRPAAWVVNFWVQDADATAAAAPGLGGTVVAGPFDTPTSRDAVIADPGGAVFSVSTAPNQR
jgi:predicted enzyme related to lactoylglutathione lyase